MKFLVDGEPFEFSASAVYRSALLKDASDKQADHAGGDTHICELPLSRTSLAAWDRDDPLHRISLDAVVGVLQVCRPFTNRNIITRSVSALH